MYHINMKKTGENIEGIIKKNKRTVKDIQRIFNFNGPQAVYKWQRGECLPDIEKLMILAKVFDMPMEKIIVMED